MATDAQPIFELDKKLRGLMDWAVQSNVGGLKSIRAIARTTGIKRSRLNTNIINDEMAPANQEALAKAFGFDVDWPEWRDPPTTRADLRRDSAEAFLKKFFASKSSSTTLAPAEPSPEAGLTLSIATGKLDLVPGPETDDAFDRATQIALHRRINRQIAPLLAETAKVGNRHPSLARAVDEYATLVSKPFDGLDVVDLWAVGNGLLAHAYSFEHQDKNSTLTEPLEPSHLALLLDVSRLHAGFILGFPKGIELTERADHASKGPDVAAIVNESILKVLDALSPNSKLVSERARRLAEVLSGALVIAGWKTARVGYTSYAFVRNALIQLGKVSLWINDKGGSLVGTVIVGAAASTVPRETWELAERFLSSNASDILAFAAPFPELRVWIGWIIDQFDGERSSPNSLGDSKQRSFPSRPAFSIFHDDFEEGTGRGPDLVVIPEGTFLMGSAENEARLKADDRAYDDEIVKGQGKRPMRIARRFALGRYPVTFEDYDAFLDATKAERKRGEDEAGDHKWGRGRRPAINVSWHDAQAYCDWLNRMTGLGGGSGYRLPSDAEWEYACRAGTQTRRWWGDEWDPMRANGNDSFEDRRTSPVEHYPANPWGLHDMTGNVWEWCADVYAGNIAGLPPDGAPYVGTRQSNKSSRVLRGGSWVNLPHILRSAVRNWNHPDYRNSYVGFRVARTL